MLSWSDHLIWPLAWALPVLCPTACPSGLSSSPPLPPRPCPGFSSCVSSDPASVLASLAPGQPPRSHWHNLNTLKKTYLFLLHLSEKQCKLIHLGSQLVLCLSPPHSKPKKCLVFTRWQNMTKCHPGRLPMSPISETSTALADSVVCPSLCLIQSYMSIYFVLLSDHLIGL